MHGNVSVARCAELLSANGDKIERSALSRYCDTHGLKLGKQGREVLVNYEAVQKHRAANYTREIMSGHPLASGGADLVERAQSPIPAPVAQIPARDDPARELKAAQLRQTLREEALALGELTLTAEVDAGMADAIAELRSAFAAELHDQAELLAAELRLPPEQVRQLRAGLKRYARIGQSRFAAGMVRLIAAAREPEGAARARLAELTALAVRQRARAADTAASASAAQA